MGALARPAPIPARASSAFVIARESRRCPLRQGEQAADREPPGAVSQLDQGQPMNRLRQIDRVTTQDPLPASAQIDELPARKNCRRLLARPVKLF